MGYGVWSKIKPLRAILSPGVDWEILSQEGWQHPDNLPGDKPIKILAILTRKDVHAECRREILHKFFGVVPGEEEPSADELKIGPEKICYLAVRLPSATRPAAKREFGAAIREVFEAYSWLSIVILLGSQPTSEQCNRVEDWPDELTEWGLDDASLLMPALAPGDERRGREIVRQLKQVISGG